MRRDQVCRAKGPWTFHEIYIRHLGPQPTRDNEGSLASVTERDVLILGAGFSKAIHDAMPTLDELGNDCRGELYGHWGDRIPERFDGGYFEVWLSRIAEDQPDLSEVENTQNRALFLDTSAVINKVITHRQRVATTAESDREWLFDLVDKLHRRRATVITLNYDNLIELAVRSMGAVGRQPLMGGTPPKMQEVMPDMLLLHQPPYGGPPPTYGALQGSMVNTFRLLKIHGSLDWWWAPDDDSGATLSRSPLVGGFGALCNESESEFAHLMRQPGRVPFIVPPTATKSRFYRNPLIRSLFMEAAKALKSADRLTIFGYSVPQTDLVVAEVLRERLSDSCAVTVVNPDVEGTVERLARLGVRGDRVDRSYADPVVGAREFVADF